MSEFGIKSSKPGKNADSDDSLDINFHSNSRQLKFSARDQITLSSGQGIVSDFNILKYTPACYSTTSDTDGYVYPNQNIVVSGLGNHVGISIKGTTISLEATSNVITGSTSSQTRNVNYLIFYEPQTGESVSGLFL